MKQFKWSSQSISLAKELHSTLSIGNKDWHQLKGNADIRAAELLSGALVQLLNGGKISDVEEMASQSIKWMRREIKDPGCPHH